MRDCLSRSLLCECRRKEFTEVFNHDPFQPRTKALVNDRGLMRPIFSDVSDAELVSATSLYISAVTVFGEW